MPSPNEILVYFSLVSAALLVLARTPPAWGAVQKMLNTCKRAAIGDVYKRLDGLDVRVEILESGTDAE